MPGPPTPTSKISALIGVRPARTRNCSLLSMNPSMDPSIWPTRRPQRLDFSRDRGLFAADLSDFETSRPVDSDHHAQCAQGRYHGGRQGRSIAQRTSGHAELPHRTLIIGNTNEGPPLIRDNRARPYRARPDRGPRSYGPSGANRPTPVMDASSMTARRYSGPLESVKQAPLPVRPREEGRPPFRSSDLRAVWSGPVGRSARTPNPTGRRGPPFFAVSRAEKER